MRKSLDDTRDVAEAAERMYESMEELSSVVSNLAAISEESAAVTQQVTASVAEQYTKLEKNNDSPERRSEILVVFCLGAVADKANNPPVYADGGRHLAREGCKDAR